MNLPVLPVIKKVAADINGLMQRHLAWIDRTTCHSPRNVLLISLLLLLLFSLSICKVRFETDIFRLFPSDRPAIRLLLDSLKWSGGANDAYFLLEGDPALLPGEAARLAERLKQLQVDDEPAFKRVTWRIFEESEAARFTEFVAFAAAHPAAFVPLAEKKQLVMQLSPAGLEAGLDRLTSELAGGIGAATVPLALADPLGLRGLFLPRLKAGSQALDLDPSSPYFQSRDGKVLIMIAEPVRPVQQMAFARKLVAGINNCRVGLKVQVSCAGAHISAVIDEAAMKRNILACIGSSLLVVLSLFYLIYRRFWPTLLIPLVLGAGILASVGTAGFFLKELHIISFAFMALIIGLGADYSIHLYDRFHTERGAGADTDQALSKVLGSTGQGLLTAAWTTSLPFLVMSFTEVRALSELGLLVGLGLLFSLYTTLFLLPILLRKIDAPDHIYRPLYGMGLNRIWRFVTAAPVTVFIIFTVLLFVFLFFALKISFDGDLKNLQPQHSEAFKAQTLVEQHLNLAPKSLMIALDGADQTAVVSMGRSIEEQVADLAGKGQIRGWSGLGQIFNRQPEQKVMTEALKRSSVSAGQLKKALSDKGFNPESFRQYLNLYEGAAATRVVSEGEIIARLQGSPLRGVVDRHLAGDENGWHSLTYLYFNDGQLDLATFSDSLRQVAPAVRLTSTDLVSKELLDAVRKNALWGILAGTVLVLLMLFNHFNNLRGMLAALLPVLVGALFMLGAMNMSGMKLNFMNIMVLVTILGMGSDYGLHLQHRITESGGVDRGSGYVFAARAVILSAITTIAGFGSLAFADYGAISSLGWATNFGIGFTAISAILLVPAMQRRRCPPK